MGTGKVVRQLLQATGLRDDDETGPNDSPEDKADLTALEALAKGTPNSDPKDIPKYLLEQPTPASVVPVVNRPVPMGKGPAPTKPKQELVTEPMDYTYTFSSGSGKPWNVKSQVELSDKEIEQLSEEARLQRPEPTSLGNIDLFNRPRVQNGDGSHSTVRSISFEEDGQEILIPTVSPDGRILSNTDAIDLYHKTGEHLGKFASVEEANAFAQQLHEDYANGVYDPRPGLVERMMPTVYRVGMPITGTVLGMLAASGEAATVAGLPAVIPTVVATTAAFTAAGEAASIAANERMLSIYGPEVMAEYGVYPRTKLEYAKEMAYEVGIQSVLSVTPMKGGNRYLWGTFNPVGAAKNAITMGGVEVGRQITMGDRINWSNAGISAGYGALFGGILTPEEVKSWREYAKTNPSGAALLATADKHGAAVPGSPREFPILPAEAELGYPLVRPGQKDPLYIPHDLYPTLYDLVSDDIKSLDNQLGSLRHLVSPEQMADFTLSDQFYRAAQLLRQRRAELIIAAKKQGLEVWDPDQVSIGPDGPHIVLPPAVPKLPSPDIPWPHQVGDEWVVGNVPPGKAEKWEVGVDRSGKPKAEEARPPKPPEDAPPPPPVGQNGPKNDAGIRFMRISKDGTTVEHITGPDAAQRAVKVGKNQFAVQMNDDGTMVLKARGSGVSSEEAKNVARLVRKRNMKPPGMEPVPPSKQGLPVEAPQTRRGPTAQIHEMLVRIKQPHPSAKPRSVLERRVAFKKTLKSNGFKYTEKPDGGFIIRVKGNWNDANKAFSKALSLLERKVPGGEPGEGDLIYEILSPTKLNRAKNLEARAQITADEDTGLPIADAREAYQAPTVDEMSPEEARPEFFAHPENQAERGESGHTPVARKAPEVVKGRIHKPDVSNRTRPPGSPVENPGAGPERAEAREGPPESRLDEPPRPKGRRPLQTKAGDYVYWNPRLGFLDAETMQPFPNGRVPDVRLPPEKGTTPYGIDFPPRAPGVETVPGDYGGVKHTQQELAEEFRDVLDLSSRKRAPIAMDTTDGGQDYVPDPQKPTTLDNRIPGHDYRYIEKNYHDDAMRMVQNLEESGRAQWLREQISLGTNNDDLIKTLSGPQGIGLNKAEAANAVQAMRYSMRARSTDAEVAASQLAYRIHTADAEPTVDADLGPSAKPIFGQPPDEVPEADLVPVGKRRLGREQPRPGKKPEPESPLALRDRLTRPPGFEEEGMAYRKSGGGRRRGPRKFVRRRIKYVSGPSAPSVVRGGGGGLGGGSTPGGGSSPSPAGGGPPLPKGTLPQHSYDFSASFGWHLSNEALTELTDFAHANALDFATARRGREGVERIYETLAKILERDGAAPHIVEAVRNTHSDAGRALQKLSVLHRDIDQMLSTNPAGQKLLKELSGHYPEANYINRMLWHFVRGVNQSVDFARSMMTTALKTQMRNAGSNGMAYTVKFVDASIQQVFGGPDAGKAGELWWSFWRTLTPGQAKKVYKILDFHEDLRKELGSALLGEVFGAMRPMARRISNLFNAGNNMQEMFFRRSMFDATLRFELGKHIEKEGMSISVPEWLHAHPDMVPRKIIADSVQEALYTTLANNPAKEWTFFKSMMSIYETDPKGGWPIWPILAKTTLTFPRFMMNQLKMGFDYSPGRFIVGLASPEFAAYRHGVATKADMDYLRKVASGGLIGTVFQAIASTLRIQYGGDEWWKLHFGEHNFDIRPFAPWNVYFFVHEIASTLSNIGTQFIHSDSDLSYAFAHRKNMTMQEFIGGALSMNRIGGTSLSLLDWLKGVTLNQKMSATKMFFASWFGALTTPLRSVRDIAAGYSPQEADIKDTRELLIGPLLDNIPSFSGTFPSMSKYTEGMTSFSNAALPNKFSIARSEAMTTEHPWWRAVGMNMETARPLEDELGRLNIVPSLELFKSTGIAAADNYVRGVMGKYMTSASRLILKSPNYQIMDEAAKRVEWSIQFQRARKVGMYMLEHDPRYARAFIAMKGKKAGENKFIKDWRREHNVLSDWEKIQAEYNKKHPETKPFWLH